MRTRRSTALLVKAALVSAAYQDLHRGQRDGLKPVEIALLRELDLGELRRGDAQKTAGLGFQELRDVLGISPAHLSVSLAELEAKELAKTVRSRGRHREIFRITAAGTEVLHRHLERVIAEIHQRGTSRQKAAIRWLVGDA